MTFSQEVKCIISSFEVCFIYCFFFLLKCYEVLLVRFALRRLDVVLFGNYEYVDEDDIDAAYDDVDICDLLLFNF